MLDSAARAWRVVSAALCFVGFGAGGLFLRGVIFPLLALLIRQPQARAYRAKEIVHAAFRLLVFTLQVLGVLRLEVRGRDRLRADGLLIVANHPSLLDVVFLIALVRHGDCLVKSKLRDNPFTAGAVRAAGYICNDQGLDVIAQCVASVRDARNSLIIFPEGTRSTEYEESQTLRRGAAHVAIAGRIDITPVVIDCHPPFLARGQKWHKAAARRPHIVIDVRPTLTVRPFLRANMPDPIAARHLTAHLTKYFAEERSYVRAGRRDQTAHYQHPGA